MSKVYNIPVELNEKRQEQVSGLEALHRLDTPGERDYRDYLMCVNGEPRFVDYTTRFLARSFVSVCFGVKQSFDDAVKMERSMYCRSLFAKGRKAEVLDVFKTYPALVFPGEEKLLSDLENEVALEQAGPEEKLETVSNAEKASVPASAVAHAREEEPETLISVRDASGVVRMVTLDEMEEMREAAQGIYAGEPPEPQDEPEEPDEPDADEALDELWEDSEIVSNAEEKPSPLIKDNSDGYFYYLEHGHWPPDDEVLAGAGVPCTGDYGLSDCLVVTQSTLDFVDAFFT